MKDVCTLFIEFIYVYKSTFFMKQSASYLVHIFGQTLGEKLETDLKVSIKIGSPFYLEHLIENFTQEPHLPPKALSDLTTDLVSPPVCIRSVLNVYLLRFLLKGSPSHSLDSCFFGTPLGVQKEPSHVVSQW